MDITFNIVFYGSFIMLGYTYLGYPLLLALWARLERSPIRKAEATPSVTVVIAAWNEAMQIQRRVQNCLDQEYPESQLDVLVVSDGSTDGTDAAILAIASKRVTLISLKNRNGKAIALNHAVASARGEVIVFTDARQRFASSTVRELVANFADSSVGAVTGELTLEDVGQDAGRAHAVSMYWKIEKWIRKSEGAIDSVIGVTGAVYAIRKQLFQPLPPGTILDDLLIPMRIAMKGYRVVFEQGALAFDSVTTDYRAEFSRKVRTLAGNYQAMNFCPTLLNPWKNRLFFHFLSHKVCRLLAPFCMVLLLIANLNVRHGWPGILLAAQVIAYGMALIGWGFRAVGIKERVTAAAFTFCLLNCAALFGAVQFFSSRPIAWEKTV